MTQYSIDIPDGIIPEGYEPVAFDCAASGEELFWLFEGRVFSDFSGWPQLILRKLPDPYAEVKEQLRHCFKEGTVFKKSGSHWVIPHSCDVSGLLPNEMEINWPDVPVGTEFEL